MDLSWEFFKYCFSEKKNYSWNFIWLNFSISESSNMGLSNWSYSGEEEIDSNLFKR